MKVKYPAFQEWFKEVESANARAQDNPYGVVELGIQLRGASFGTAVQLETIALRLGGNNPEMKTPNSTSWYKIDARSARSGYFRTLYTDHKPEFKELLDTIKLRVEDKNKAADKILYALVKDHIPAAVIKRMEGVSIDDSASELMNMAIEDDGKVMFANLMEAIANTGIQAISIRRPFSLSFLDNEENWTIDIQENIIIIGPIYFYPPQAKANIDAPTKEKAIYLLYRDEIHTIVNNILDFIRKAKYENKEAVQHGQ